MQRLESTIADILAASARSRGVEPPDLHERAELAGRSVFAVLHLALAQPSTGAHAGHDAAADLRGQIAQIVAGFLARKGEQ